MLVLILGMVSGGLGLVDFSTDKAGSSSSKWACAISSIATFFSWLKAFYFLRAFPTTGGLVRMVVEIGFDMRYLLVLLMVVMMGASTSLFVLMTINYQPAITGETEGCTIDDWETLSGFILGQDVYAGEPIGCKPPLSFWGMIMYAFSMMLGGFDIYFFDSLNEFRLLGQVLFIIYILFQMVLLLNLLIAFMGDSYAKVQEKAKTEALRERAGLLVEIELVMGQSYLKRNNYCPRWLHALVPKETVQVGASAV